VIGPEATVVLCTRNRAAILPKALETLARQVTDRSFEVIVIDNASDDGTADVIADWCRRDGRFRMFHEPRVGLSRAKNTGIEAARGNVVLFTDDDVLVDPNWVEAHLGLLSGRDELLITGGPIHPIPHDLRAWPDWLGAGSLVDLPMLDHGPPPRPLGRWDQVWGANMAVPRGVFDRIGRWNEELGRSGDRRGTWEDLEFADRVRNAGGQVWFCPGALVYHRVSAARARPRQMLRLAFRRGLDDYVKRVWASDEPGGARLTRLEQATALLALAWHLLTWMLSSLVFRVLRRRRLFDAARDAAWCAGTRMMELTLRRTPGADIPVEPPNLFDHARPVARVIMQACFFVRRVATRLAPG
jgi:glycosyltransferase involved in cell wall biosynthesis